MKNTDIFEDLARHYAQQNPPQEDGGQANPQDENGADPEQVNPAVDTDSLQQGQVIYDLSGKEFTVLEPTPDGKKNIMPSDQIGQQVPQGIKQIGDDDLGASYTTSPQASRICAQEEPTLNWADFDDILGAMKFAIDKKDAKALMEAAEDMIDLILLNVSLPEDTDISQIVPKSAEILPAFRISQMGDLQSFHEPQTFSSGKDDESGLTVGEGGFGDCMARLKELLSGGYEVVDIILTLGEEYPRELANKVLAEAREKGIL